jgi:hypothetical protein
VVAQDCSVKKILNMAAMFAQQFGRPPAKQVLQRSLLSTVSGGAFRMYRGRYPIQWPRAAQSRRSSTWPPCLHNSMAVRPPNRYRYRYFREVNKIPVQVRPSECVGRRTQYGGLGPLSQKDPQYGCHVCTTIWPPAGITGTTSEKFTKYRYRFR